MKDDTNGDNVDDVGHCSERSKSLRDQRSMKKIRRETVRSNM